MRLVRIRRCHLSTIPPHLNFHPPPFDRHSTEWDLSGSAPVTYQRFLLTSAFIILCALMAFRSGGLCTALRSQKHRFAADELTSIAVAIFALIVSLLRFRKSSNCWGSVWKRKLKMPTTAAAAFPFYYYYSFFFVSKLLFAVEIFLLGNSFVFF